MSLRCSTWLGFQPAAGSEAPTAKLRHENEKLKRRMELMDRRHLTFELDRIDREVDNREQELLHLDRARAHTSGKLQRSQSWNARWNAQDDRARRFREVMQGQRQGHYEAESNRKTAQLDRFQQRKHKILVEFPADMLHEREVISSLQGNAVLDLVNKYRKQRLGTA